MMVKEHLAVTVHGGDGIFCLGFAGILACSFNMERLFFLSVSPYKLGKNS